MENGLRIFYKTVKVGDKTFTHFYIKYGSLKTQIVPAFPKDSFNWSSWCVQILISETLISAKANYKRICVGGVCVCKHCMWMSLPQKIDHVEWGYVRLCS